MIASIGSVAHAQSAPATANGEELDVALLTFGPGTEIWERFGHNAILVRDRTSHRSRLYNYGIFDFDQENFFLNFARGRMMYRMAAGDADEELAVYEDEGRWIVEQDLNLEPAQKAKLADFLEWNARPENANYRYNYFTANCSTRTRDALDQAVGGLIRNQTIAPSRGFTYRMDTLRLVRPDPLIMIGMDAGLGPYADQRLTYWDESFLPTELMRHLRDVRRVAEDGETVPLVSRETRLAEARVAEPLDYPPDWFWYALAIGIGVALLVLALSRARASAFARAMLATFAITFDVVMGLAGLVLLGLWFLTDHESAWRNQNVLLFDPLCFALVPAWFRSFRARWSPSATLRGLTFLIALLGGLALFIKVFQSVPQDNRFWIALLLPVHVAFAIALIQRPRTRQFSSTFR